ncbi:hypothetical protein Z2181 [Escherichia coli O157:H7 str. EDL933]|nr:hypothetical protein Z2181 [Escherichia coli O157:H7 str. EDL933]
MFQEGHLLRNSIAIFALTTLFYFIGAELQAGSRTFSFLAAEWRNGGGVCPLCLA